MMLTVLCPGCEGEGSIPHRLALTSDPHTTCDVASDLCGTCNGTGELEVQPEESDGRRLFCAEEEYVTTEHPPFWIGSDLYVLDEGGNTVLVEDVDVDCGLCGGVVEDGSTRALCRTCDASARAHGRLDAERQRQERAAVA